MSPLSADYGDYHWAALQPYSIMQQGMQQQMVQDVMCPSMVTNGMKLCTKTGSVHVHADS